MTDKELETTAMMHSMMLEKDDEVSLVEEIEQFEDKIQYLDITEDEKEKIRELCSQIKAEENEEIRKRLFQLLEKEIEEWGILWN